MKVDVVLSPPEIDLLPSRDLSQTTAVVFDVLRATSSMITALEHGAQKIYPVRTIEEALALKKAMPEAVLGGERHGDRIEGFALGNSPREYLSPPPRIVTTTTNGTFALKACEAARETFVGALLNMNALALALAKSAGRHPSARLSLLIVCAGTFRELALEDVFAAGMLCSKFPGVELTDSARVALELYRQHEKDTLRLLHMARNGRALKAAGREQDIQWCGRVSCFEAVGILREGAVCRV
jgi:2-phosphosulfolactate phosphatase